MLRSPLVFNNRFFGFRHRGRRGTGVAGHVLLPASSGEEHLPHTTGQNGCLSVDVRSDSMSLATSVKLRMATWRGPRDC